MDESQQETPAPSQGNMSKVLLGLVLVVLVGGGIWYVSSQKTKQPAPTPVTPTAVQTVSPTQTNREKLSDNPDARNAYKVFPGDLSADAKTALTGFDMQTKQLAGGATQVTLVAKKQEYTTQTLTVQPGESVYFIERMLRDDNEQEEADNMLADDKALVVDKDGFIVSQ